jgi:hypothetical protein
MRLNKSGDAKARLELKNASCRGLGVVGPTQAGQGSGLQDRRKAKARV